MITLIEIEEMMNQESQPFTPESLKKLNEFREKLNMKQQQDIEFKKQQEKITFKDLLRQLTGGTNEI